MTSELARPRVQNKRKATQRGRAAGATSAVEQAGKLAAIDRVQAIIEFEPDGVIQTANQNFLSVMGYSLSEITGKHHSMFVEPGHVQSDDYRTFWQRMKEGHFHAGEWKRIGKGGREVWLLASYNPIFDAQGRVFKVVKYATDVTQQKLRAADYAGQVAAIGKSQAVIEFDVAGRVLGANELFLKTFGYSLEEVVGQHHRMFVDPSYAQSPAYRAFWQGLSEGRYDAGEYKRIGKNGREVWIQASYNPILDLDGKPSKVVKYATDVTEGKLRNADYAGQIKAIDKSQAVIEFDMSGRVLTANAAFLNALGYSLEEVVGQHHRMFVEPDYARGPDYQAFWKRLADGRYDIGEYKRIGKNGREVWIQASYNPILDLNGKPFKVVKYATDVTPQKRAFAALMGAAEALAQGDLSKPIEGNFVGDFARLRDQLNTSFSTLSGMVHRINHAVDTISSASTDISEGNSNLNSRTQAQSSALEETASSLEELTATVKQNASNTLHANSLAAGAREAAEKGGNVVNEAVVAMTAITESAGKVADIISVIQQIAFQTNMLALNAAVEAARAGDQGRGFAVVAGEVRNLAQRSANAAKEINALIRESQERVEQGARLVNRSGETLHEIVGSVKKVSDIIGEITAASEQQASGIDQINSAIAQMDENTQQNAAMVEQSTAAAESMAEQAQALSELVGLFKVGTNTAGPQREAAAPAPDARQKRSNDHEAEARHNTSRRSATDRDKRNGPPNGSNHRPAPAAEPEWTEF